jgi:NAD(P)H-flavin reductase
MLTPEVYQVKSIFHDTPDVFTLTLSKREMEGGMEFIPGQFNMLYQFGYGEVAISISGDPERKNELVHTIRAVGGVTCSLQKLNPGEEIGVRGPFGSYWPISKSHSNVLVVAGGIGIAALRSTLYRLAKQVDQYQKITLLYGARMPQDVLYQSDIEKWKQKGLDIEITVDHADIHWKGHVGVVTKLIKRHVTNPNNTQVLICGPEIMMKFAIYELLQASVREDNIYLSMERNMQCALGFCGHCQYGPYFVCKDGPVFSYLQLKTWLQIKEL